MEDPRNAKIIDGSAASGLRRPPGGAARPMDPARAAPSFEVL
jgi:hypothetical protein